MNPVFEVLNNGKGTDCIKYQRLYPDTLQCPIVIIYYSSYRLRITPELLTLYHANIDDGFYHTILETVDGYDSDEYFNLSMEYELNDICLKNNIDKIRKISDNLTRGLHVINL